MGRVPACLPISSRKRTVVRLRRPHALSLSVNALRHRMHQKRRLCSTNSTICPRNGTSRLQRGRTSCCLTHIVPQCGHFSPFFVAITSTRSFPSACTSCLRIHRLSNSKGTMIPCVWLGSSSVICWLGIACPPGLLGVLFLPNPTKDKLVVQFSSNFTLKDGEPRFVFRTPNKSQCDCFQPPLARSCDRVGGFLCACRRTKNLPHDHEKSSLASL